MNSIRLNLKVREARALANILPSISSKVDLTKVNKGLKAQLEAYDEKRRRDEEEKLCLKRLEDEQKRLEQLCVIEGHLGLVWDDAIRVIDCQTLPGMAIQIPECARCQELLVRLADGSLNPWDAWAKTGERLHAEMLGHVEEFKAFQSQTPTVSA